MIFWIVITSAVYLVWYLIHLNPSNSQSITTSTMSLPSAVRVVSQTPKLAIIFFHGLGDSGSGWLFLKQVVDQLKILTTQEASSINYVFPNAPERPVTANGGYSMPAWFDIFAFGDPNAPQDIQGTLALAGILKDFVQEQIEKYNIPPEKIIIGGFSQGSAVALTALHTLGLKVGGAVLLSGFLPIRLKLKELLQPTNLDTPIFHGHGTQDPVVPFRLGERDIKFMKEELGFKNLNFHAYQGVQHSASDEELIEVQKFIKSIIE